MLKSGFCLQAFYAILAAKASSCNLTYTDIRSVLCIEKFMKSFSKSTPPPRREWLGLLDAAPLAMIVVDHTGAISFTNQFTDKLFGYTKKELLGKTVEFLMPSQWQSKHLKDRKTFFQNPQARPMGAGRDLFAKKKNGKEFPAEIGLSPFVTEEGQFVIATVIDITERKKVEGLKEEFLSMASHELRTPLALIGMGTENLLAGIHGELSEKQTEVLGRIQHNVKHLIHLINNFLELSHFQLGRTKIERKQLDLNSLIHDLLQSFRVGPKGGATIEEKLKPNLPRTEADPGMITEVLTNLLSNAIRYAKKKIEVTTNTIREADGSPCFIETSISNDGPGIPHEKANELFKKFAQLDREKRTGDYKGMGLGLAICKEIIEQHQGKIWIESSGEKGVSFHFTLPIHAGRKGER